MMPYAKTWWVRLGWLAAACWLGGCAAYELRGVVVRGQSPGVQVVEPDDPRLSGQHDEGRLPGAQIEVVLDPGRLNREALGPVSSGPEGGFAVPVDAVGAGLLEYEAQVTARLEGYDSARRVMMLPPAGKRLLITLKPGRDTLPPDPVDVIDETMEMSRPYLRAD